MNVPRGASAIRLRKTSPRSKVLASASLALESWDAAASKVLARKARPRLLDEQCQVRRHEYLFQDGNVSGRKVHHTRLHGELKNSGDIDLGSNRGDWAPSTCRR